VELEPGAEPDKPDDKGAGPDEVVLHVRVVDTGIGISPEQTERLFEPFRQADASTTRLFGGTGLGLAIARQVVAALGGEIGVTSELGMGSTFWFTARFAPAGELGDGELLASAWSASGDDHDRRGHVLVVEDNDINQLVAMGLLEALGYTADLAADGAEAVSMASTTAYDAVLMDLQMPGMDGFEASRLIRAREPAGTRVPIVAMTASAIDGERERCLAAGMDDFLTKPVDSARLEAVLRARRQPGAEPTPDEELTPRPPVDLSRLQELLDLGAEAAPLVERAIENFLTQLPQQLDGIETAVRLRDSELLRQLAHRLRGSALNLGALRFADVALAVESHADADAAENAERLLPQLRETAAEAVAVLNDYRSSRVAT
jgi:CheY-like chemotaxis protein